MSILYKYFGIITATFSIWIANVLPIPSLDGGYVFFIEMIMGRYISDKFVEKSTIVGYPY
ncbi:MAG: hypothetical protein ACFIN6_00105 [Candidatus Walczuchella monophlebidarum]